MLSRSGLLLPHRNDFIHYIDQIESLLHTSPQIFRNEEWKEVMRVPAKYRGFKVVIALQLRTHTIAWLSMDNLCYVYWFSRKDMEAARAGRVPGDDFYSFDDDGLKLIIYNLA